MLVSNKKGKSVSNFYLNLLTNLINGVHDIEIITLQLKIF